MPVPINEGTSLSGASVSSTMRPRSGPRAREGPGPSQRERTGRPRPTPAAAPGPGSSASSGSTVRRALSSFGRSRRATDHGGIDARAGPPNRFARGQPPGSLSFGSGHAHGRGYAESSRVPVCHCVVRLLSFPWRAYKWGISALPLHGPRRPRLACDYEVSSRFGTCPTCHKQRRGGIIAVTYP